MASQGRKSGAVKSKSDANGAVKSADKKPKPPAAAARKEAVKEIVKQPGKAAPGKAPIREAINGPSEQAIEDLDREDAEQRLPAPATGMPPMPVGLAQVNLETPGPLTSPAARPERDPSFGTGSPINNPNPFVELKSGPISSTADRAHAVTRLIQPAEPPRDEAAADAYLQQFDPNTLDIQKPSTLASPPSAGTVNEAAAPPASADASGPVLEANESLETLTTLASMPRLNPAIALPPPTREPEPPVPAEPGPPRHAEAGTPVVQPALLFEIGWEVCWQLGGIYTVLRSKAEQMLKIWGDRYCLIGPYNPNTAPVEFEPQDAKGPVAEALQRMRDNGVPCHYGHWLVAGNPRVILLDYRAVFRDLDHNKYLMWKDHGIAINSSDGELNEVVAFGFAVTEFFRLLAELVTDRPILAHFHEWMGGVAVPRIAHLRLPISTIFTTHATLLGRYIAGDNAEFYNHLPFLNADAEAHKYQIYSRYQIEKAAAHASTVFTTVSEVTSFEAEKLLGRRPDCILPNGLNIQRFSALHEFQNLHREYKEKIHKFVMGHFFPCYTFDLDKTIYLVTSGRYEYRNKGMDLYIEAMHRLNQRLKYVPDRPTVVSFIITKAPVRHVNIGALQNQTMFSELESTCKNLQEEMGKHLFSAAAHGRVADAKELLTNDAVVRLKRAMHAWRTGQPPAIVTHDLMDDANDPTLKHLRYRGLFNGGDDPVKVVFHPQFVNPTGPLINLEYEQFVRGCHMGIFPSYYEPWGYTPMECIALGLPAVTTDLSGFGAYVRRHLPESGDKGICVLNRRFRSFDDACNELVDYLFDFVRLDRRKRIELRNKVERLSELFDWSALIRHYREAHDMALERIGATRAGRLDIRMV